MGGADGYCRIRRDRRVGWWVGRAMWGDVGVRAPIVVAAGRARKIIKFSTGRRRRVDVRAKLLRAAPTTNNSATAARGGQHVRIIMLNYSIAHCGAVLHNWFRRADYRQKYTGRCCSIGRLCPATFPGPIHRKQFAFFKKTESHFTHTPTHRWPETMRFANRIPSRI